MTPIRLLRMAWTGAIVAAVSGFLFLAYAPIQGSYTADTLLTIGVASLGAAVGVVLESKLENLIMSRRSEATIWLPTTWYRESGGAASRSRQEVRRVDASRPSEG